MATFDETSKLHATWDRKKGICPCEWCGASRLSVTGANRCFQIDNKWRYSDEQECFTKDKLDAVLDGELWANSRDNG